MKEHEDDIKLCNECGYESHEWWSDTMCMACHNSYETYSMEDLPLSEQYASIKHTLERLETALNTNIGLFDRSNLNHSAKVALRALDRLAVETGKNKASVNLLSAVTNPYRYKDCTHKQKACPLAVVPFIVSKKVLSAGAGYPISLKRYQAVIAAAGKEV